MFDIEKGSKIYLGCPYSTPDGEGDFMQDRFEAVTRAAGILMALGYLVISPITHGHPIAKQTKEIPREWTYWENVCRWQLTASDCMMVLKLDGWEASTGLTAESDIARESDTPIYFTTLDDLEEEFEQSQYMRYMG